jgi:hypothetical protein
MATSAAMSQFFAASCVTWPPWTGRYWLADQPYVSWPAARSSRLYSSGIEKTLGAPAASL